MAFRLGLRKSRQVSLLAVSGAAATLTYAYTSKVLHTEKDPSKDAQLDYSQHAQVTMSWEKPGCYIWGSNRMGVADPTSGETHVKTASRIKAFDNMAMRDLKVNEKMGVAVLDSGDVCQWGRMYHDVPISRKKGPQQILEPEVTLKGKDIIKVELSDDRIYALSANGTVYALPFSKAVQAEGPKLTESSWFGMVSSEAKVSYNVVQTPLANGDKISDIAAGMHHLLLLSNNGTVLATSDSEKGNARGQMGIENPQQQSSDKPPQAFPVEGFKRNAKATAIACGDHHSIVLDEDGEVFTFGSNAHGQLAFDFNADTTDVRTPTMVSVSSLYPRNYTVKCLKIAGGGKNTYMVVQTQQYGKPNSTKIDIWASGMGQFGQLGNNTWNHVQAKPVKLKIISGLTEWDEVNHIVRPIGVHSLSVGSTHAVCCLDNYSKVDADASAARQSFHDVNYGRDVFVWGGNQDFQIGNGKRNNRPMPEYISPMEASTTELAVKSGWGEGHNRFQLTPSKQIEITSANGKRVKRVVEQAILAGDKVSCCYMKLADGR